jgi:hypothetical protein
MIFFGFLLTMFEVGVDLLLELSLKQKEKLKMKK